MTKNVKFFIITSSYTDFMFWQALSFVAFKMLSQTDQVLFGFVWLFMGILILKEFSQILSMKQSVQGKFHTKVLQAFHS